MTDQQTPLVCFWERKEWRYSVEGSKDPNTSATIGVKILCVKPQTSILELIFWQPTDRKIFSLKETLE